MKANKERRKKFISENYQRESDYKIMDINIKKLPDF